MEINNNFQLISNCTFHRGERPNRSTALFGLILIFIFFILLAISPVNILLAQELNITASLDKQEVSLNDEIHLIISVEGRSNEINDLKLPDLSNFNVYFSGRSQNITWINGKFSSSYIFNYTLSPKSTGNFTVGAITLEHNGITYTTSPMQIKVTASSYSTPDGSKKSSLQNKETEVSGEIPQKGEKLFVTASVDKDTAYLNEQITFTFRFYTAVNLLRRPQYLQPDFTGFWTEDLPPARNFYANLNGTKFLVNEIKAALFANIPGAYTIGSAILKCNIRDFSNRDPFFENFFTEGKDRTLKTKPIKLEILPLPEGAPVNFTGAVGNYQITASLEKESTESNQPVNLKIEIKGTGNIKTILLPEIDLPGGFKKYEPVSSDSLLKENYKVSGSKVYHIMIVPQKDGDFQIGPIKFTCFDLKTKSYVTLESEKLNLKVLPSKGTAQKPQQMPEAEKVKLLGGDISFIKLKCNFKNYNLLYKNKIFISLALIPLVVLIYLLIAWLNKINLVKDPALLRKKKAKDYARASIEAAKKCLKGGENKYFYGLLYKALDEYLSSKLNLEIKGKTLDQLKEILKSKMLKEELIKETEEVLTEVEMAKYTPSGDLQNNMQDCMEKAIRLICNLEKEVI